MKKVLLLNGAKQFAHSDGRYNATLHDTALAVLDRGGVEVKVTHIDEGYDIREEVEKFLWADVIVYQMPGWWMGACFQMVLSLLVSVTALIQHH